MFVLWFEALATSAPVEAVMNLTLRFAASQRAMTAEPSLRPTTLPEPSWARTAAESA